MDKGTGQNLRGLDARIRTGILEGGALRFGAEARAVRCAAKRCGTEQSFSRPGLCPGQAMPEFCAEERPLGLTGVRTERQDGSGGKLCKMTRPVAPAHSEPVPALQQSAMPGWKRHGVQVVFYGNAGGLTPVFQGRGRSAAEIGMENDGSVIAEGAFFTEFVLIFCGIFLHPGMKMGKVKR